MSFYDQRVLVLGPEMYIPLNDDVAATQILDASGNGYHSISGIEDDATATPPTLGQTGPMNASVNPQTCALFAEPQQIEFEYFNDLGQFDYTAEWSAHALVRRNSGNSGYDIVARLQAQSANWATLMLWANRPTVIMEPGSGAQRYETTTSTALDTWAHIVWVFNEGGTNNISNTKIYLDGTLLAAATSPTGAWTNNLGIGSDRIVIGGKLGLDPNPWNGNIACFALYQDALQSFDVQYLYKSYLANTATLDTTTIKPTVSSSGDVLVLSWILPAPATWDNTQEPILDLDGMEITLDDARVIKATGIASSSAFSGTRLTMTFQLDGVIYAGQTVSNIIVAGPNTSTVEQGFFMDIYGNQPEGVVISGAGAGLVNSSTIPVPTATSFIPYRFRPDLSRDRRPVFR